MASKAYRGVLKARISKLYGGDVTVEKARKLKNRKDATPRDKQLANWFINMQTNRPSPNKKKADPKKAQAKSLKVAAEDYTQTKILKTRYQLSLLQYLMLEKL